MDELSTFKQEYINKFLVGDSSKLLKEIPSNSIQLVITSPPYFKQRDYGNFENEIGKEDKVEEYINNLIPIFKECVRIIKPEGSIVFNVGDKYDRGNLLLVPFRFAIEAQKHGVILNNMITWIKTNPTPKQYKKRLINSTEPFFHFVKSGDYLFSREEFFKDKNDRKILKKRPRSKIGLSYYRKISKSNLTREQKELARTELREVINEVKNGKIDSFRMKIRGIHAPAYGGQDGGRQIQFDKKGFTIIKLHGIKMKKDIINNTVETIKGNLHPAIYPEKIIDEFIKLLTKPDDIVLDPFVGSGTTCVSANKLGRKYIGIDINPKYMEYARKRIKNLAVLRFNYG